MTYFLRFCLALTCSGTIAWTELKAAPAQTSVVVQNTAQVVYKALLGKWTGSLEYRDYSNNKRVTLPAVLEVSVSGEAMTWHFTYDDGPGKTVTGEETIVINAQDQTFREQAAESKTPKIYHLSGLNDFAQQGQGQLVVTGIAEDDSQKVDLRKTLTIMGKSLTILKEVRPPGAEFLFRNKYTFKRAEL